MVRVGGTSLYVGPLVLALPLLLLVAGDGLGGPNGLLVFVGVLLGSVLLHETGHALAARRLGLEVGGIYLHLVPFAYVQRGRPAQELVVALAGPAVNLLAFAALWIASGGGAGFPWLAFEHWGASPLWIALGVNGLMGTVNLVPALPADGGRALRAALMLRLAPAKAYAYTARVGTFVGVLLLLASVWVRRWPDSGAFALLGVFVIMVAWREARRGQVSARPSRPSRCCRRHR